MLGMLNRNEADVMMTLDSHIYQKDLVIAKEAKMAMHFVTGAQSPFRGQKLRFAQLADQPFILTEKGMGYRRVLDERLAQMSVEVQPVLEVGRTDLICSLLEKGNAISFLPDFVTNQKVQAGTLVHLDVEDVQLEIWQQLIYHRSKWMSQCLETFIHYVREKEFSR
jgi:DNA-binding transcriptional LysR family regulator